MTTFLFILAGATIMRTLGFWPTGQAVIIAAIATLLSIAL